MFKQYMQAQATDFVQVDACRLGGLSEVLAVLLLAAKFQIPIHPVSLSPKNNYIPNIVYLTSPIIAHWWRRSA